MKATKAGRVIGAKRVSDLKAAIGEKIDAWADEVNGQLEDDEDDKARAKIVKAEAEAYAEDEARTKAAAAAKTKAKSDKDDEAAVKDKLLKDKILALEADL